MSSFYRTFLILVLAYICDAYRKKTFVSREDKDLEWWKKAIIYQVYPRSFKDSNNDGIGDLNGVTSKLDYLATIGVTAIWLNPIYTSGGKDYGYDVASFVDIDPEYGTMADFDELVEECHRRGIYVIMDFIPNHTSDKHKWFVESRKNSLDTNLYRDYYVWHSSKDRSKPPNNWVSYFGGPAWSFDETRSQWYLHHFLPEQPDLNYRNPQVKKEIEDVIKFWLLEKNMDGLRVDALANLVEDIDFKDEPIKQDPNIDLENLKHPDLVHIYTVNQNETLETLVEWRKLAEQIMTITNSKKLITVEVYDDADIVMKYCIYGGQPAANFPFNFQLIDLRNGLNLVTNREGAPFHPQSLQCLIDPWFESLLQECWSNWQLGNHDNTRVASRIGSEYIDLANTLNLLLSGTTVTYYGEEIGMVDLGKDKISYEDCQDEFGKRMGPELFWIYSRDYERTPMQWSNKTNTAGFTDLSSVKTWLPVNENYFELNVEKQLNEKYSHLEIYKFLAHLRQESSFLWGDFQYLIVTKQIFSFTRRAEGHTGYLVAMNLSDRDQTLNFHYSKSIPDKAKLVYFFGKDRHETSELHKTYQLNQTISTKRVELKAKNCFILSFD